MGIEINKCEMRFCVPRRVYNWKSLDNLYIIEMTVSSNFWFNID